MSTQTTLLHQQMDALKLPAIKDQYNELAQAATQQSWSHVEYLSRLVDAQYQQWRTFPC
jgi:DNA replication protein DnaC